MKKNKVLAFGLCSFLLLSSAFVGCSNDSSSDSSNDSSSSSSSTSQPGTGNNNGGANNGGTNNGTNNGATNNGGTSNTSTENVNTALQAVITAAKAGSSVSLSAGTVAAGSSITIDKALTVDGNGIEGLTVKVSSDVSSNVVLKNFKKATIKVYTPAAVSSSVRSARAADGEPAAAAKDKESSDSLKKFGDDVMPLFLEGCSIEKLEAEEDFALYLGSGDEKTVIEELCLKEGVEDFTFIEFDEKDTATADKSKVEKFSIEDDGIKEINLIGGTFGDVDFADDITNEIDFKYDKEFEDQFAKYDFMEEDFINEKDIAVADNDSGKSSGIYKMTVTKDELAYLNKHVSIVLITDEQKKNIQEGTDRFKLYSPDYPVYCMGIAGDFKVETDKTGLTTIHGTEETLSKPYYRNGELYLYKDITFETYPNYEKNAVVADVGEDTVTYYVNMNAIKKSDLLIGAEHESTPMGEPGDKLSVIDLTGYKPYFAINMPRLAEEHSTDEHQIIGDSYTGYEFFADGIWNEFENDWAVEPLISTEALKSKNGIYYGENQMTIDIPVHESVQLPFGNPRYFLFPMEENSTYPAGAATLEYRDVEIEDMAYYTVYYFDEAGKKGEAKQVIKMALSGSNIKIDDYEYYSDEALTQYAFDYAAANPDSGELTTSTLYARPARKLSVMIIDKGGELECIGDRLGCIDTNFHEIYLSYDESSKKPGDKVTINELAASVKDGDTVYVVFSE